ncbi:MAG: response regulator [Patescibacteria group bacterium]|nr:response regulator [Patescibacteria group bacterium]
MKKILIVEDDQFLAKLLASKLASSETNLEVETAFNGEEALKKIQEKKYDLIVLDLILPQKDGFEFLAEKQKSDKIKETKIIILSCLGQEQDREKALKFGAVDYLVKSQQSLPEVVERIKKHL